jgi:hypothetical protein
MGRQLRLRRQRVTRTRALVALGVGMASCASLVTASCSSSDKAAGSEPFDAAFPDYEAGEATTFDRYSPPQGADGGLGVGMADVGDTPCATRGGTLATVLSADAGPAVGERPQMRSLAIIGARRASDTVDGSGILFFDADGKNATLVDTKVSGAGAIATMGSELVLAGTASFTTMFARPFDASGNGGQPSELAPEEGESVAIGASDTESLVTWTTSAGAIRARGFAAAGPKGDAFDFALGALTQNGTIAVANAGGGLFAAAFSGARGEDWQTAFGRSKDGKRVAVPHDVFTGPVTRHTIALVKVPTGYAMLLTVNDGPGYAALSMLDELGFPSRPVLKLVGTLAGLGLAVNGSDMVVVAARDGGKAHDQKAVEMRTFSLAGDPSGSWVCLDGPVGPNVLPFGAPVADGAGFSILFRASDGSTALARVDRLGTGSL